jgi:hypothetical protein
MIVTKSDYKFLLWVVGFSRQSRSIGGLTQHWLRNSGIALILKFGKLRNLGARNSKSCINLVVRDYEGDETTWWNVYIVLN